MLLSLSIKGIKSKCSIVIILPLLISVLGQGLSGSLLGLRLRGRCGGEVEVAQEVTSLSGGFLGLGWLLGWLVGEVEDVGVFGDCGGWLGFFWGWFIGF